uniref:JNK1/MAPK8-associated membrane protein n=1 Tax=Strigamia maritima TaxID=126957 RepID=T1J971_STRMM
MAMTINPVVVVPLDSEEIRTSNVFSSSVYATKNVPTAKRVFGKNAKTRAMLTFQEPMMYTNVYYHHTGLQNSVPESFHVKFWAAALQLVKALRLRAPPPFVFKLPIVEIDLMKSNTVVITEQYGETGSLVKYVNSDMFLSTMGSASSVTGNDEFCPSPLTSCPGYYCGRTFLGNGTWSSCRACPRGFRVNSSTSECIQCTTSPQFYDWFYLAFMAFLPLVLHWFCIDLAAKRRSFTQAVLVLHVSAFIEVLIAAVLTILFANPFGSMKITSCPVRWLSDWYTLLYNPSPDYTHTLHCTQEAVYPLYTIVFVYYALCLILMMLFRPLLVAKLLPTRGKVAVYAALYFLPVLCLLQAIFAGLIYFSFPYITIIISVVSSAAHFAFRLDQSMKSLLVSTVSDIRNVVILLGHWALHAFGIVAVTQLKDLSFNLSLLVLVPFPGLFYILTAKFTDPHKLHTA